MNITHMSSRHGGKITALHSVGHSTFKGVAEWFFIGDIKWNDGTESKETEIMPWAVCTDQSIPEAQSEAERVFKAMNDYLGENGEWHDRKQKSGLSYSWTPKVKKHSVPIESLMETATA